jgi:hypothetical protein
MGSVSKSEPESEPESEALGVDFQWLSAGRGGAGGLEPFGAPLQIDKRIIASSSPRLASPVTTPEPTVRNLDPDVSECMHRAAEHPQRSTQFYPRHSQPPSPPA